MIVLSLLLIGAGVGWIVGMCFEACRPNGSLDQYARVRELEAQKQRLVGLLAAATKPHQVPAQRGVR